MAKLKKSMMHISGKLGEHVYVSGKYGRIIRRAPEAGMKKDEPALKTQYSRTGFLNNIASDLNNVMKEYGDRFKGNDFYQRVQRQLRKEPLNNRLLLLYQTKGMEINTAYPLERLNTPPEVTVEKAAHELPVQLSIKGHPDFDAKSNCYFIEVIVLMWGKGNKPCIYSSAKTAWIYKKEELHTYVMPFKKPGNITDYMVCVRETLGKDNEELDEFAYMGMRILEAGTFNKATQKILDERQEDKNFGRMPRRGKDNNITEVRIAPMIIKE